MTDDRATPNDRDTPRGSPLVLITGMHRSGTSLLASMLGASGVDIGERLIGPGVGNERGHFEDERFVAFHDRVLAAAGASMYIAEPERPPAWTEAQRAEAAGLVRLRRAAAEERGAALFGFKDPRSALFLDEWSSLVGGDRSGDGSALLVATWRPWRDVVDSLRRRRDPALRWTWPGSSVLQRVGVTGFNTERAARMWALYNRLLLDWHASQPGRALLVEAGSFADTWPELVRRLSAMTGVTLNADKGADLIEPGLLRGSTRRAAVRGFSADEVARLDALQRSLMSASLACD